MKKIALHIGLVLILCSLVLVLPAAAAGNGKIAFVSNRDGNQQIYIMNSDGSGQTRLTNNLKNDTYPVWSPDGTKIAFMSDRDGYNGIFVMNADGTGQIGIAGVLNPPWPQDAINPSWSQDGKKIIFIFEYGDHRDICVINPDGTGQNCITENLPTSVRYNHPLLSPNGNKIAFSVIYPRCFDSYCGADSYIFAINVDGTGFIVLRYNDWDYFNGLEWSPDGTKIAFRRQGSPYGSYINIINPDGTGLTGLNQILEENSDPKWSPDGQKIAYRSLSHFGPWGGLFVTNADGSEPRYDSQEVDMGDRSPAWSPDSTKIAFVSDRDGNEEIYVKNADGTGSTRLTNNAAFDNSPAWGPGTATATITVTSPNGGETWQRGTPHNVTWDYAGSLGSNVKIVVLKAGIEVGTISASTSIGSGGKGSYTWPIYPTGSTGGDYKVSVQSISQPAIKDTSNNYFTITPAGTVAPSITVTSPNGGESWKRGTTHSVTWDYTGSPGSTVKIVLMKGGVEIGTLTSTAPIGSSGKGSYTWTISSSGYTGSDFKVSVQSVSQPTIKDLSNGYFTLTL